jgi:hypothetical protein
VLGATQARLFGAGITNTNYFDIYFPSGNQIRAIWYDGAQALTTTTAVFRDPSAWYHVVVAVDTTQATASNRIKIYVNSIEQIRDAVNPNQNLDTSVNSTVEHGIGRYVASQDTVYFDGYLTEINFIDGSALTPTSFGEFNSDTGVWQPKAYTGSYGTNGFYLPFSDNASTTTLGEDQAGSNNWTTNNFSVTAGAGNDSLVDSPTRYGTDTGVGGEVRGNYATWNPVFPFGNQTFSEGNLRLVTGTTGGSIGTIALNQGKWYWEITAVTISAGGTRVAGISELTTATTSLTSKSVYYQQNGNKIINNSSTAYGASFTDGDIVGVALDVDAKTIEFYKNGSSQGSIDISSVYSSGDLVVPAIVQSGGESQTITANFGQRPFASTAPSGFKALVTTNLPAPTIEKGGEYFNTVLYTGTGSSLGVTGVGFQPDWVWIKERNGAADHGLYDVLRGVQNQLESNTTTAETAEATGLTAFGSDGFTVGALAQLNTNTDTYVAWNWKANGAGVSNTAGTITSTVSVNTTSGFSIVTYTGTGANATVGHGLGAVPSFIIIKNRDFTENWGAYHVSLGNTKAIFPNLTAAAGTYNGWNNTTPTSTVFSLGDTSQIGALNRNGEKHVAYCFAPVAGYSAFGSYTGNGSTDGPFVFTNFRPRYVLIKQSSAAGENWTVYDSARNTYNITNSVLFPDSNSAEFTSTSFVPIDLLSNGFKIRTDGAGRNANGATYIFAAFAESPFAYSLAR